jgi:transposase-like protein
VGKTACPTCQQPASKRNGRDRRSRQKYACRPCRRTFTENTISAFSGYRWPVDVILTAVRWYLAYSSRQVIELLAERGIDVSHRTVLNWVQTFGPQLAAEVRRRRRPIGRRWMVDEVFLFRKNDKRYLYRAIDEDGVVVDVLLREHRDTASAEAFFRQAIERTGVDSGRGSDRSPSAVCEGRVNPLPRHPTRQNGAAPGRRLHDQSCRTALTRLNTSAIVRT